MTTEQKYKIKLEWPDKSRLKIAIKLLRAKGSRTTFKLQYLGQHGIGFCYHWVTSNFAMSIFKFFFGARTSALPPSKIPSPASRPSSRRKQNHVQESQIQPESNYGVTTHCDFRASLLEEASPIFNTQKKLYRALVNVTKERKSELLLTTDFFFTPTTKTPYFYISTGHTFPFPLCHEGKWILCGLLAS